MNTYLVDLRGSAQYCASAKLKVSAVFRIQGESLCDKTIRLFRNEPKLTDLTNGVREAKENETFKSGAIAGADFFISIVILMLGALLFSDAHANPCKSGLHFKLVEGEIYIGSPDYGWRKLTPDQRMEKTWIELTLVGEKLMMSQGVREIPIREIAVTQGLCGPSSIIEPDEAVWNAWGVWSGSSRRHFIWVGCAETGRLGFEIRVPLFPLQEDYWNHNAVTHYRVDGHTYRTIFLNQGKVSDTVSLSDYEVDPPSVTQFIEDIMDGDLLELHVDTFEGERLEYEFQITGLREALNQTREDCEFWKYEGPKNPAGSDSERETVVAALLEELERDQSTSKRVEVTPASKWHVSTKISEIDDSTNVYMKVKSNERGRRRNDFANLRIHCRENRTSLTIRLGGAWAKFGSTSVTYRIDRRPAGKMQMGRSSNNEYLGLWGGSTSIPFIKKLFGADKLLIDTPVINGHERFTFQISGLEEAIKPLREACNW